MTEEAIKLREADVPLTDLEIFAQVISAGSLSSAGRNLGYTPAMISKRIKGLESRLGVRLIQRTTRNLALTDTGQIFHERVTAIISAIEEAEAMVSGRAKAPQGQLHIAAPTSFGRMHLIPNLASFLENNPQIDLEIDLTDRQVDLVSERIDAAIRIGVLEDSSLVARKISSVRRFICATPEYIEQWGEPHRPEDLAAHRLLGLAAEGVWRLDGPDGRKVVQVQSAIRTKSNEVIREALLAGLGIALCSSWDVAEELANGRLVSLMPAYRSVSDGGVYVVYPSRRQLAPSVRAFIEHVSQSCAAEPFAAMRMPAGVVNAVAERPLAALLG